MVTRNKDIHTFIDGISEFTLYRSIIEAIEQGESEIGLARIDAIAKYVREDLHAAADRHVVRNSVFERDYDETCRCRH